MEKIDAIASLGQAQLLRPAYLKAALAANDRLKLYLTALQTAYAHAAQPQEPAPSLQREYAAARPDAPWLLELPQSCHLEGTALHGEALPRLMERLASDLRAMARPLEGDDEASHLALLRRVAHWCDWLGAQPAGVLDAEQLRLLTSGKRGTQDSFHLVVMDLHRAINRLAQALSQESLDGAHIWQLDEADRPRVAAFMRGLNRTRGLKLSHPGLDTAATRDGARLLIQNDIGTNDAHVLVLQVEELRLSLTYSDLHRPRFAFFQQLLSRVGAEWSDVGSRVTAGLNAGEAYFVGTATFDCVDEAELHAALEGVGAHIVFLIDWNRARKRLRPLLGKAGAIAVLSESAARAIGHMGWLEAGAENLLHGAMEAVGSDYFRIGDSLTSVLGEAQAQAFVLEVFATAMEAMQQHQPLPRIAEAVRLLLLHHLGRERDAFALLGEHAAYCHALSEALRDALVHGLQRDAAGAAQLAARAKGWEHQADQLVMHSRERAARNARWQPFTQLIERADDAADALEEALFLLSLIAEGHHDGWQDALRERLQQLADRTHEAVRNHVRTLAIASLLRDGGTAEDHQDFLAVSWRVVDAERQCDSLLREVRRALVRAVRDPVTLSLVTDFAAAVEQASDALMTTSFGLRRLAFDHIGARQ